MMEFIIENLTALIWALIAFAVVITRLTPTQKDNDILNLIIRFLNVILPNNRKGGGLHK